MIADLVAYRSTLFTSGREAANNSMVSFFLMGVSSAILDCVNTFCCIRMCPQKLKTLLLITFWKPLTKLTATIMMATLIIVAVIARPIMKRENVFCLLKAIRLAIKDDIFTP